jgi:hypothetical protein
LNPDAATELLAQHEPTLAEVSQAKRAGEGLPAFPDMKRDPDPKLAGIAQEAAKVPEPSRTVGQENAQVSLSFPPRSEGVPSVDRRVARSLLTSNVRGREPADQLGSSVTLAGHKARTVFYFTELRDLAGHTVLHRWERNGKVVATLPFKVDGPRWRVYSSATLTSSKTGDWRVVVADTRGTVLASQHFVVVQR